MMSRAAAARADWAGKADSAQGPVRLKVNEGSDVIVLALERRCPSPHPGHDVTRAGHRRAVAGRVPVRLAAGGRPRGRIGPARPGSRPASASARRSRNSIWALVLRSSSLAHLARASWTAGSSRRRMLLRSVTTVPWLSSLVEGAGVDDRLGGLLAAQHHEQVGDHRCLALLIQLDDVLFLEPLQGQLDHADRAFHDCPPGADHRVGPLLAQHGLGAQGRRPIRVPLTPVKNGISRSPADSQPRSSGHVRASEGTDSQADSAGSYQPRLRLWW
jgi:hypothetical protein